MSNRDVVRSGRSWRGSPAVSTLVRLSLVCSAFLFIPLRIHAQQDTRPSTSTTEQAAAPAAATTPAAASDSAACDQVIGYVMQHPELIQENQRLQLSTKAKQLMALPDSSRARIGAAVTQGQVDSIKAAAGKALTSETAKTLEEIFALMTTLPDTTRAAVGSLITSGKLLSCSP